MNLNDRVKQIFGLEDEPNCTISIDLDSGDLNIDCSTEAICRYVRKNHLKQLVQGGVALGIPHMELGDGSEGERPYRFPPACVLDYGIRWDAHYPGVKEARYAEKAHKTKLFIMSQMGIDVDGLNFPPEYKEGWQCSDES